MGEKYFQQEVLFQIDPLEQRKYVCRHQKRRCDHYQNVSSHAANATKSYDVRNLFAHHRLNLEQDSSRKRNILQSEIVEFGNHCKGTCRVHMLSKQCNGLRGLTSFS
ncbi:hypothetical protein CDAR_620431 [Caerostris darwini]|uniref:Uncharacterized protein n=1 Tax=Caerostris darwini TaxID=1538125 RepID=A0AAV4VVA9_9ARAC|nr:hypothetical protein CDAR_620431 [Caerostris darwini]